MMQQNYPTQQEARTHYSDLAVQFEIAKACQMRECSALRPGGLMLKPFKMFRQKDVAFWVDRLHLDQTPTDLYMSLFRVDLPLLPSDIQGMRRMQDTLKETWLTLVRGYSWFADIDAMSPAHAQKTQDAAVRGTEILRDMGLPAYPVASGTGWNIRIDEYGFKGEPVAAPDAMRELARQVAEACGVPFSHKKEAVKLGLDVWFDNSVYDTRRIFRIPFTINTKSGLVVTPMTLGEARQASPDWFQAHNYAKRWEVRDRLRRVNEDAQRAVRS